MRENNVDGTRLVIKAGGVNWQDSVVPIIGGDLVLQAGFGSDGNGFVGSGPDYNGTVRIGTGEVSISPSAHANKVRIGGQVQMLSPNGVPAFHNVVSIGTSDTGRYVSGTSTTSPGVFHLPAVPYDRAMGFSVSGSSGTLDIAAHIEKAIGTAGLPTDFMIMGRWHEYTGGTILVPAGCRYSIHIVGCVDATNSMNLTVNMTKFGVVG